MELQSKNNLCDRLTPGTEDDGDSLQVLTSQLSVGQVSSVQRDTSDQRQVLACGRQANVVRLFRTAPASLSLCHHPPGPEDRRPASFTCLRPGAANADRPGVIGEAAGRIGGFGRLIRGISSLIRVI